MTQAPEASSTGPVERVAGRYRLLHRIAKGGMGEVFAAVDEGSGTQVALKRLRNSVLDTESARVHFRREYQALAQIDHPRIIDVHDYGVSDGVPYYTMELLDGRDLRELAPLSVAETCRDLRDVASSIALLHARRLLHRDLSPRNVRRTPDGHCKLLDFGTMVSFGVPRFVAGTPPFVPPEALHGEPLDQRADLFSLGALGYWLLTKRHAYPAKTLQELPDRWKTPPTRLRRLLPEVPPTLEELILSLLQLEPQRRPTTAAEVIERLTGIAKLPPEDSAELAKSYLITTRLCGRDAELARIERSIERTREGRGAAVVIAGEGGIGKSRLLSEAAVLAQTRGLVVLRVSAHGSKGEHALARAIAAALETAVPDPADHPGESRRQARTALAPASAEVVGAGQEGLVRGEHRARLQAVLADWVCGVAERRPLMVAVDDLHLADEFSAALVAALAHQSRERSLLVAVTRGIEADPNAALSGDALARIGSVLQLSPLSAEDVWALASSVFGTVPNLDRLAAWLHDNARGNPALTLELVEHLVEQGVVRYAAGTWVLPEQEITVAVPRDLLESLLSRLARLSGPAYDVAQLFSLARGGMTDARLMAASPHGAEATVAALQELVGAGVLLAAGDAHVFAHEALREAVEQAIEPTRSADLHRRLADALAAEASEDLQVQLEAAWHGMHTERELEAAEQLARIVPRLVGEGIAVGAALPAAERALEIMERCGSLERYCLSLRAHLLRASYTYDYRIAQRHGQATLEMLDEASGLAEARRLAKRIGPVAALSAAFGLGAMRTALSRGKMSPLKGIAGFGRVAISLIGVRATALDGPGCADILERIRPFAAAPAWTPARPAYKACQALALQPLGHPSRLVAALEEAIAVLDARDYPDLPAGDRQDLSLGLRFALAINLCYLEGSDSLERADALERMGSRLAYVMAQRVRMTYHMVRGNDEQVEHYRRAIDLHGIQGGSTWQVEWFSLPIEGMASALIGDVVGARRALDRLEQVVIDVPSLLPMRDMVRAAYQYRKGALETAVELGQRFMAEYPPGSVIGWASGYSVCAAALLELGRFEEAKAVADGVLEASSEEDHAYFPFFLIAERVQALAIWGLGDRAEAERLLEARIARLEAAGEHSMVAVMHDARARMARQLGERDVFAASLAALRQSAVLAGNALLLAQGERLAAVWARGTLDSAPPSARTTGGGEVSEAPTAVQSRLTPVSEGGIDAVLAERGELQWRARQSLRLLAGYVEAACGHLFVAHDGSARLVASLGDAEPPEPLELAAAEWIARGRAGSQGALRFEGCEPGTPEPDHDYRLALLATRDGSASVALVALRELDHPLDALPRELMARAAGAIEDALER